MPVSLFYHYTDIADVDSAAKRIRDVGRKLKLAGRIRLSNEGINGTFGGLPATVAEFHEHVLDLLGNPDIEFKVSEGSAANFPEGWKVRVCQELVTMGISPEAASWRQAAPHLEATEFRREVVAEHENPTGELMVLDVRNQYEHAIGHFKGAKLPPIRQFSDFPLFVKSNPEIFRHKRVLMYCTGGIRCERASAFLQREGLVSSVAQLRGGIDRFLNKYPCGGDVFEGKNLVFDTRMAISTTTLSIVGRCICCGSPWDDYRCNWRCSYCRSRVLLCNTTSCRNEFTMAWNDQCSSCRTRCHDEEIC